MTSLSSRRMKAIQAKQELLESLGLQENLKAIEHHAHELSQRERAAKRARQVTSPDTGPRRRSLRQQGLTPTGGKAELAVPPQLTSYLSSPNELPSSRDGDMMLRSALEAAQSLEECEKFCEGLANCKTNLTNARSIDYESLDIREEKHVIKAAKDRVYSVLFHPRNDRPLIMSGHKWGGVSCWFPDVEDPNESVVAWKPHNRAVSGLTCPVSYPHQIYTASYEGRVCRLDAAAQVWQEICVHDFRLCYCDVSSDNRHLYATSAAGDLVSVDLRTVSSPQIAAKRLSAASNKGQSESSGLDDDDAPRTRFAKQNVKVENTTASEESDDDIISSATNSKHKTYNLHDRRKVGSVSISSDSNHVLTAAHDSTVAIWDVRKLAPSSRSSNVAPVATLNHGSGVTSAFYSPSGTRIVSTCNDNKLRIFDAVKALTEPKKSLITSINHNNHTGRWLSNFRTIWDPRGDDTVLVGAMGTRCIEAFDASTGKKIAARNNPDMLTAVPTINAIHPSMPLVASSTASGRLYLWS